MIVIIYSSKAEQIIEGVPYTSYKNQENLVASVFFIENGSKQSNSF